MPKSLKPQTVLPKSKFFEGLGSPELREILAACEIRRIATGGIVVIAGDLAAHLFLMASGQANSYRLTREGDKVLLMRLRANDVFGLGTLLPRRMHYIGTVETTCDSELLVWEHTCIRKIVQKYPRLTENAMEITLRYLSSRTERMVDLITLTAAQRLARVVFHLGRDKGKITAAGVEIAITNEELSALANVSPFTTSRLLNRWARLGALAKSRGKLLINSPEDLLTD
jgi:CRP-like cAMP-binding protein